jgi:class 3 adenylate cyclase
MASNARAPEVIRIGVMRRTSSGEKSSRTRPIRLRIAPRRLHLAAGSCATAPMALAHDTTLAPISEPPLRRKIAAILAADVAGYSRLVAEAEEDTLRELAAAREIFDGLVARGGGRIFNTAGDSVMCEFDSAVEAVRVAVEIQAELAGRNTHVPANRRLEFRMGMTIGDVVERGGDLLGDGVNIASRLEGLAPPGGICVSRNVHEAVANKISVGFRDLGERRVKNIPGAVQAFVIDPPRAPARVIEAPLIEPMSPRSRDLRLQSRAPRRTMAGLMALAGTLVLLFTGVFVWPRVDGVRTALLPEASPPSNLAATPSEPPPAATSPSNAVPSPDITVGRQPNTGPAQKPAAPQPPAAAKPAAPKTARPALPADPAAALATLSKEGIVAEPASIAELYHNARLQEGKDKPAALRSYAALMAKSTEFLDVDLRYAGLLRQANGVPAARSTFADLARTNPSKAVTLVAATMADPAERRSRLEALAADDPDFAPTSYFLSEDYMAERAGGPTLTERRLAFDALDTFLEASNPPALAGAFLERSVLTAWREAATKRQSEIQASFAGLKTRTTAVFTRGETGWTAALSLPEPALGIAVRLGEQGDFHSTGTLGADDPRTGKPAPRTSVELPAGSGRATLYVTYTDMSGHVAGPFPIQFDPTAALVASERETLERYPESWVTFRQDIPDLLSVTQLLSNRCAITRALIGFGDGPPRDQLPLPPCNEQNPYAIPANARSVLNIPPDTETVQVQLSYADGTESTVRTFRRP